MIFDHLNKQPDDPILALTIMANNDPSPNVIDLGAGVFKNPEGQTPILEAVRIAEPRRLANEDTRAYQGIMGDQRFNEQITKLILGDSSGVIKDGRVSTLQTIAGSAAVLMAGQLISLSMDEPLVWVGTPTWANHHPLLATAGVKIKEFPYYDAEYKCIQFDAMMGVIDGLPAGSVVLLHGCCHNPTGADLSKQQWTELAELMSCRGLVPFFDVAYQGFGAGLDEDAYALRLFAGMFPELLISFSCSKNFSLYRDRIGALVVISKNREAADITRSNMMRCSRATYSMPAAHGAFLVAEILSDAELRALWVEELGSMRERINDMRASFTGAMDARGHGERFAFIAEQFGMFSFLGINAEQVKRLREEFSIYMAGSSRISIAGITPSNVEYLADSVASVLD